MTHHRDHHQKKRAREGGETTTTITRRRLSDEEAEKAKRAAEIEEPRYQGTPNGHTLALQGDYRQLRLLLKQEPFWAFIKERPINETALGYAVVNGDTRTVRLLTEYNPDAMMEHRRRMPICTAVVFGSISAALYLLARMLLEERITFPMSPEDVRKYWEKDSGMGIRYFGCSSSRININPDRGITNRRDSRWLFARMTATSYKTEYDDSSQPIARQHAANAVMDATLATLC